MRDMPEKAPSPACVEVLPGSEKHLPHDFKERFFQNSV